MLLKAAGAALSFLVTLTIARWGGAAVSGEYALAVQTVLTASAIALFGNDRLLTRRVAGDLREGRSDLARAALWHSVKVVGVASIVVGALVLIAAPFAVAFDASPAIIALCSIGVLAYPILNLAVAALRGMERVVVSQLFYGPVQAFLLLGLILLLGSSVLGISAVSATFSYVLSLGITAIWVCILVFRAQRGWPKLLGAKPDYRATGGMTIGFTLVIDMLTAWLSLALIGSALGVTEIGAFRVCMQIITIITMIFTTFDSIVSPQFAGDFRVQDVATAKRRYFRSIGILAAFTGVPIILAVAFPYNILLIFGPEFIVGVHALQILALGQLVNVVTGPVGSILIMGNRERINLRLAIAGLAITILLITILVPVWGLAGAAWAVTIALTLRKLTAFLVVWRMLNARPA